MRARGYLEKHTERNSTMLKAEEIVPALEKVLADESLFLSRLQEIAPGA